MELRVLKYFLATARTENISRAARELNISQPALSRQLMDLEDELGVKLLFRSKKRTTLTEAGYLLKRRAEEISALVDKTVDELANARAGVSGNVRIGCGETFGMQIIARAVHELRRDFPHVYCHLYSMDSSGVKERLERGTLDFGVLVQPAPPSAYQFIELAYKDVWGVLMRRDSPLAALEKIRAEDLDGLPLILSQQSLANRELEFWFGKEVAALNVVATYTLIYNASLMAEAGVGYVLTLDKLLNLTEDGTLIFRPLEPPHVTGNFFIWKQNQIFSRAASLLREKILQLSTGEVAT